MRRTLLLLFTTMAVALVLGAGMAWAAPGAPTVVRTVPPEGATNVALDAHIKAKFSEAMKYRTINTNTFYLTVGGCTSECLRVPAEVRYHGDTKTAILDPTAPLAPNTQYTATVEGAGDTDQQAVTDRELTPMASDYTFSFTTGSGGGSGGGGSGKG